MSNPNAYIKEIDSLTFEIKRLNTVLKKLRKQKRAAQTHLYNYMVRNKIEKYGGHTIKSVCPRQSRPRKSKSAKKADAIELFRQVGIVDPEKFFTEFNATQKYGENEPLLSREPTKRFLSTKKYDPFLGF